MTMTQSPPSLLQFLHDAHEFHERAFGPLRDAMPQQDAPAISLDDLLPRRPAPPVVVNIFLNQDSEQ